MKARERDFNLPLRVHLNTIEKIVSLASAAPTGIIISEALSSSAGKKVRERHYDSL